MRNNRPTLIDYLLLSGLALVFGASFLFTSLAVRELPPLTVAVSRLALAAMLVSGLMLVQKKSLPKRGQIWWFIVGSAFFGNALPFALVAWGQVKVDAGLAAILMAVMPLITVVIAHALTVDEKLNRYKIVGVLCGLVGVVVLMGWNQLDHLGDSALRQYAIAIAAVSYAVNAIITKRLTSTNRVSMIAALLLVATAMLIPVAWWFGRSIDIVLTTQSVLSVLVLAIGPTALAMLVILVIIDRQGASFLSQINFFVPLFGVLLARVFLGETLPTNAWIALIVILFGVYLSRRGSA